MWKIGEVEREDGIQYRGRKKLTEKKGARFYWTRVEREKTEIGEPTPPQKLDDEDEK